MDKESARLAIAELVAEFKVYRQNNSIRNETELSEKFVRPLFALLGWDAKADYSLEEHVAGKFADIGYYVNGVPAFYVETKDVYKNLRDKTYMQQAINYSYLRGVTWAVLTDFETMMVFNAEWAERDPNESKFFELAYTDYTSEMGFEDLWLLSKASFEANPRLIDQRAERYNRKDKKRPVSEGLLAELLDWRRRLFQEIRIQADTLWAADTHKVDNAIQKFFDRLIFIRTMEDRKIEEPRLRPLLRQRERGAAVFPDLLMMFRELDEVYNSNLFAEHRLDLLDVHDPFLIEEIVEGLYKGQQGYVQYDFAAISADVLGAVYEQYLGFKAQYPGEEDTSKNLKRKLQGIYYTPQYVVRYIVQQTLGRLLQDGRDPMTLRVLDPACGSGAFLIEAFDVLRRAYTAQYPEMPIAEVTHYILTTNLYGVDLDDQAVEVTRLNLSLRGAMTRGLLPTLVNIKHGNSLIADDAIAGEGLGFDWAMRFADVIEAGGFDAVIGNPPYGIVYDDKEKHYLEEQYPTFKRNNEKFVAFAEKAVQVGKQGSLLSYIVPNTYLKGPYYDNLKQHFINNSKVIKLVDFETHEVFSEPNVFTSIFVLEKSEKGHVGDSKFVKTPEIEGFPTGSVTESIDNDDLFSLNWALSNRLARRIFSSYPKLDKFAYVKDVGLNYWTKGRGKKRGGSIADRVLYAGDKENASDIPYLKGRDINRYFSSFNNRWLRGDYEERLNENDTFRYSSDFLLVDKKIIYRQTSSSLSATLDEGNHLVDKTIHTILWKSATQSMKLEYLLGLFNSKLLNFLYTDLAQEDGRLFAQVKVFRSKQLPIVELDLENPEDKAKHDAVVEQVELMLAKQKALQQLDNELDERRHEVAADIARIDRKIDALVYDLYDLTPDEIAIVEGR